MYDVVPISAVQQSDPVIHMCVCVCIYIYIYIYMHFFLVLSSVMFYPKKVNTALCTVQQDLIAHPF